MFLRTIQDSTGIKWYQSLVGMDAWTVNDIAFIFNLQAENFLSVMSSALDRWPSDKKRVSLATSALWALLYNSAKVHMHLVL